MDLTEVEWIDEELAEALAADSWTVDKLATADAKALLDYKGVGRVKAGRIVASAQRLVNERKIAEEGLPLPPEHLSNEELEAWIEEHMPPPMETPEPKPQRSVRVQRILDARARGELI